MRRLFDRWEHTDRGIELFHPDCVWDMSGTTIGEGLYHGHEGVNRFLDQWMSPYRSFKCVLEQLELVAPGLMVVRFVQKGRPHGSDVWMDQHFGALFTVEDGLIRRAQHFDRPEDAWAAAGIMQNPPP